MDQDRQRGLRIFNKLQSLGPLEKPLVDGTMGTLRGAIISAFMFPKIPCWAPSWFAFVDLAMLGIVVEWRFWNLPTKCINDKNGPRR